MPTYVCSVPPKSLSDDQKDQMAAAIGRRHGEATGAPPSTRLRRPKSASSHAIATIRDDRHRIGFLNKLGGSTKRGDMSQLYARRASP